MLRRESVYKKNFKVKSECSEEHNCKLVKHYKATNFLIIKKIRKSRLRFDSEESLNQILEWSYDPFLNDVVSCTI